MNAGIGALGIDALLAHQDFVMTLARGLLRDEDAARDVAQETWLAALSKPPRAPRSIASMRAWLARVARSRASDRVRREIVRAEHEGSAARAERDESDAELRERVALQHRVVEAVLALGEPYKTTLLRHHYEGLTAAEIARREQVPAGTVRSRISRAHALLRERLDAEFGGSRSAWAVALGAFAARLPSSKVAASAWIAGGAVAAAALVPLVAWVAAGRPPRPVAAARPVLAAVEPSAIALSAFESESTAGGRVPVVASLDAESLEVDTDASVQKAPKDKLGATGVLVNGGFEAKADKDDPLPAWKIAVGTRNGAEAPLSTVKVDSREKHEGRASLLLSGDDTTRAWQYPAQEFDARPGAVYRVNAWTKVKDVRRETVKGTSIQQFPNCFVGLFLLDDNGEVVAKNIRTPELATSGWQKLAFDLTAPETARKARISVSLTMSGSLWVDEVALEIEGGRELPPREVLVDEDFEHESGLPAGWDEVVGATNGGGSTRSKIGVDRSGGAGGSGASLRFTGESKTIRWFGLERRFVATPGDTFTFRALAHAQDVRKEGIQFANLNMRLVYLDAQGETVGTPKFGNPGDGTYDWKEVSVTNVAPDGAVQVLAGLFLSMSGDAWFDDLRIEKRAGGRPAYADWHSFETPHLTLRYPDDHPRANSMKEEGQRFERAFEDIVTRLGVPYTERITLFLYRDGEQGQRLTGRALDFADPEGRAVHQRPSSTIGHEMVHCVALKLGHAQTGLLGEGLAVYLNGAPPERHHEVAAQMLAKGELPSLQTLLDDFGAQANGYPAAGSFCGYVIENFGVEKFKQLYPLTDPATAAEGVLGKSFEALDADWRAFLQQRR